MHTNQGCALRKIEGSPVLWACKIQGAQHMICMKKLWFSSHPRMEVRLQGPPGSARAHPYGGEKILEWSKLNEWLGKGEKGWSLVACNAAKWDSAIMLWLVKCLSIDRFTVLMSDFSSLGCQWWQSPCLFTSYTWDNFFYTIFISLCWRSRWLVR